MSMKMTKPNTSTTLARISTAGSASMENQLKLEGVFGCCTTTGTGSSVPLLLCGLKGLPVSNSSPTSLISSTRLPVMPLPVRCRLATLRMIVSMLRYLMSQGLQLSQGCPSEDSQKAGHQQDRQQHGGGSSEAQFLETVDQRIDQEGQQHGKSDRHQDDPRPIENCR